MAEIPFSKTQLDQLQSVCASDPRVLAVFLFGSQLDGYVLPQSDIDLGILLTEKLTLSERLALEVHLCQAVSREDLDIIWLSEAPISIRFRAIAGRLLFALSSPMPGRLFDEAKKTLDTDLAFW
jgi:predicted nucleotidyltransferase